MNLDIRYPIGWMFSLFGVILALFVCLAISKSMPARSHQHQFRCGRGIVRLWHPDAAASLARIR